MRKILKILGIIILVLTIIIICSVNYLNQGQKEVLNTKINDIDLSKVNDGVYNGEFNGYRWSNSVAVTVKNHKITNIEFVEGQQIRVEEVEDKLLNEVIDKQSLKVDTIAGGTISSKAILKAIENAFEK